MMRIEHGDYDLGDDPARLDRDAVVSLLATADAYWDRWRKPADMRAQIDGAWRVVGAYQRTDGAMVGFSRAVSDGVAVAYLADVLVAPAVRGIGLGAALVDAMIEQSPGRGFRWMLHTKDAHGLYQKFGFSAPPSTYLERPSSRPQLHI
jgi:GNAT superfamily N-acetyltransferase